MNTAELAAELIRYDTTSPVTDEAVFHFIKDVLAEEGIDARIHDRNGVKSLTATSGHGGTRICLNGHADVVPPGDDWSVTDPFEPVVEDGKLYGRGAADMKGGLAAQIMAFIDLHNDPEFTGTATLMVVGDEELGGYDGTALLLDEFPSFDYAIIGEPTDCDLQVGVRGIYWANLYLNGNSAHASRPEKADNVIDDLPAVLGALKDMELTYEPDHELPAPTAPVTVVETDGPQNSLPGKVRIGMDIRYLPGQTIDQVEQDIRDAVDPLDVDYSLQITNHGGALKLGDGHFKQVATETVAEVMGRTPDHVTDGGSSDGRFFADRGTPFIELGPDQDSGHQADEHCHVDNLTLLKESYCKIAKRLSSPPQHTEERMVDTSHN